MPLAPDRSSRSEAESWAAASAASFTQSSPHLSAAFGISPFGAYLSITPRFTIGDIPPHAVLPRRPAATRALGPGPPFARPAARAEPGPARLVRGRGALPLAQRGRPAGRMAARHAGGGDGARLARRPPPARHLGAGRLRQAPSPARGALVRADRRPRRDRPGGGRG